MTKEDIDNLTDLEFARTLKACLLRLQREDQYGDVIEIRHDGYNASSIIVPYVDNDHSESIRINPFHKMFYLQHHTGVEINTIIK